MIRLHCNTNIFDIRKIQYIYKTLENYETTLVNPSHITFLQNIPNIDQSESSGNGTAVLVKSIST